MTSQQVCEARRRAWSSEDVSVKQIAGEMNLPYDVVYSAVIGKTWRLITEPAPLPVGLLAERHAERRRNPEGSCLNCGRHFESGVRGGRCGACRAYLNRHGKERPKELERSQWQLTDRQLAVLYRRYMAGESLDTLAERLPFSEETLRRRFIEQGLALRSRTEIRQRLNAPLVRRAREIIHVERVPVVDLARAWGVNYATLYSAVTGATWPEAGGPLPGGDEPDEQKPCVRCEMLTAHPSGLCQYCR